MKRVCKQEALAYWESVDLYIVVNMQLDIYCIPFWNKFLKDKVLPTEEPFKKLINQGMILGLVPLFIEFLMELRMLLIKMRIC
jgi:leucyl-tRNA synthetase